MLICCDPAWMDVELHVTHPRWILLKNDMIHALQILLI
jgi:hypothetical protein